LEEDEALRLVNAAQVGEPMVGRTRKGLAHYRRTGEDLPGEIRWRLTGPERALMYLFTIQTGLRRSALERLTVGDFELDGKEPTVRVQPKPNTKSRKLQIIPLRKETAALLKKHLDSRHPAAPAFDVPEPYETADMFREDLSAAREQWISKGKTPKDRAKRADTDYLKDIDAEGRRLDFHAQRTTTGTSLDQKGVASSIATRITGHATERVLKQHYHRSTQDQVRRAIDLLPAFELSATGTDDAGR